MRALRGEQPGQLIVRAVLRHFVPNKGKRQTTPRMDRHETIVTGRCETFRYCHIGGKWMTSAELKHRVKLQYQSGSQQEVIYSNKSSRCLNLYRQRELKIENNAAQQDNGRRFHI